jgi:hypothetical protein
MKIMKNLLKITVSAVLLVFCASAQLATTSTTLASAVVSNTTTQWCVASATGINLPSLSGGTAASYLFVDKEAVVVTSQGSSSTCFNVKRGQLGTSSNYSHSVNSTVWVGSPATGTGDSSRPFTGGAFTTNMPSGTCVASAQYTLPIIVTGSISGVGTGDVYTCVGGYWTRGDTQVGPYPFTSFTTLSNPGNLVAATSVSDVNGKEWFSGIYIPANATLTGACWLNGATVGTDKRMAFLADLSGAIIATSATAGVTTASASTYQCVAFTSTISVYGPGRYYVGIMTGTGATDNFLAYATGGAPTNYPTGVVTGGTFGTVTAITPNSTFTTAVGPLMMVY